MAKVTDTLYAKSPNQNFFTSFTDVVFILLIFFIYFFTVSVISDSKVTRMSTGIKYSLGVFQEDMSMGHQEVVENQELLRAGISTDFDNGQLISLEHDFLFAPGGAVLSEEGKNYIQRVAAVLKGKEVMIVVEGHTDNVPINTDQYPSNWQLSSLRAAAVTEVLNASNIPASHLKSVGYGSSRPIQSNNTELGRRLNRRVEIYVKPFKEDVNDVR